MNNYTPLAEDVILLLTEAADIANALEDRVKTLQARLKSAESKANELRNGLKLNGGNNEK